MRGMIIPRRQVPAPMSRLEFIKSSWDLAKAKAPVRRRSFSCGSLVGFVIDRIEATQFTTISPPCTMTVTWSESSKRGFP